MWNQAQNAVKLIAAAAIGYEVIGLISRATDQPKIALQGVSAVVIAMVEGFHGRIRGEQLEKALQDLRRDLLDASGVSQGIIEKFRAAL